VLSNGVNPKYAMFFSLDWLSTKTLLLDWTFLAEVTVLSGMRATFSPATFIAPKFGCLQKQRWMQFFRLRMLHPDQCTVIMVMQFGRSRVVTFPGKSLPQTF